MPGSKMTIGRMTSYLACVGVLCFATIAVEAQQDVPASSRSFQLQGDVDGVHDPSLIRAGGTWYLFSTTTGHENKGELPIRCSPDLYQWKRCGYVLPTIPEWIKKESPETKNLWAPDVSFFNGTYHIYYAFSVFGKNTSGIALITNKSLDPASPNFKWIDEGLVLRSQLQDDFNAIDPNIAMDTRGGVWMSFGSFWSGIKMRRIDPQTGKLSVQDTKLYSLASRQRPADAPANSPGLPGNWQAIEAPFIVRHADYYYLFVSFDLCCRGTKSTYRTVVGRSQEITGPYVDAEGKAMLQGGGSPVLTGNHRWLGPGGESIRQQREGDIIVFHAYDAQTGKPALQISSIDWNDGWPHATLADQPPTNAKAP
ncbi:MAG: arabinan endo-1,5-alpha-L-arabinosidase [Candidatus Acidiferrum sp.]